MPKAKSKTASKTKVSPKDEIKLLKKVVDVEDDETPEVAATELDPEVLEALNSKKVKKVKVNHPIDYIPELERDEEDM
jgi:hypothetical protein